MSAQEILSLVKSIPDGQAATVTLTDNSGQRRLYECVFKESIAPSFFLVFPIDALPKEIDETKQCPLVSRDRSDKSVSFLAEIEARNKPHILELVARKSVRPEDLREYFRIEIRTFIAVRYYSGESNEKQLEWELDGETVDLSQSGVLAVFPEECRNSHPLEIELMLLNPAQTVLCTGHIVRSKRLRKDRWLTSFHFDVISPNVRDAIAMNCFTEQRRQLRNNVQTAG
jgi:c-di-GMP-binding flagellar brake protein YcgR